MGKSYFYGETWGNHATSVSDGLSGRIVAVSGSDPGSTFHYPGSIEVRLFDIRCTTNPTYGSILCVSSFGPAHTHKKWGLKNQNFRFSKFHHFRFEFFHFFGRSSVTNGYNPEIFSALITPR